MKFLAFASILATATAFTVTPNAFTANTPFRLDVQESDVGAHRSRKATIVMDGKANAIRDRIVTVKNTKKITEAILHLRERAFVAPPSPLTTQQDSSTVVEAESRRSTLAAATAALASAWTSSAALAEEAAKPKKDKPPTNLIIEGYKGNEEETPINGRWEATFGKKVNGGMVYKRDAQNLYLLNNDCGQFQITLDRKKSTCDSGLAVKKETGWVVGSTEQPEMKVRPETKEDRKGPEKDKSKVVNLERLVATESEKFWTQNSVETFRGRMDEEEELVADGLMKKMGAKIMKGM